mmetsp:Transcript_21840/g.61841  ORF Transcript_21840/g.61841 Transcript_21840/m.61841 type:complete len:214 (-) Transcript_21840:629-1270(-)
MSLLALLRGTRARGVRSGALGGRRFSQDRAIAGSGLNGQRRLGAPTRQKISCTAAAEVARTVVGDGRGHRCSLGVRDSWRGIPPLPPRNSNLPRKRQQRRASRPHATKSSNVAEAEGRCVEDLRGHGLHAGAARRGVPPLWHDVRPQLGVPDPPHPAAPLADVGLEALDRRGAHLERHVAVPAAEGAAAMPGLDEGPDEVRAHEVDEAVAPIL